MNEKDARQPLAAILRPTNLKNFYGQQHLLSPGKPLANNIASVVLQSMLFWGPPGSGKTTLAYILADTVGYNFIVMSATSAGVKEIKTVALEANELWYNNKQKTVVFIDEIHRFNKTQQDALLPFVENGSFVLIGATTENPSFAINNALLSRLNIYQLSALSEIELDEILTNALHYLQSKNLTFIFEDTIRQYFITFADNDARKLLNNLELIILASKGKTTVTISKQLLTQALSISYRKFDRGGDIFYEQISALHKAVRGTDPDAALYWFARMIDGGCDPLYIARRVIRMASEDIGNADPRGIQLALNAYDAYQRLGSPEGELAIAQAICFLAVAPKSNSIYTAFNAALADAKQSGSFPVPLHLRNAPTKFMQELGYGADYQYDPDVPGGIALTQSYFPDKFPQKIYYHPREQGLEIKIKEKLIAVRQTRKK
jgi:putative ATPase